MQSLDYDGEQLIIKFQLPASDFAKVVLVVKGCVGRLFDPINRQWTALPTQENIEHLVKHGFVPTPAIASIREYKPALAETATILADIDTSKLSPKMYPYQVEGVRWLEAHKGSGIIGLPVGMGKSNIAASYAKIHAEDRPVLVVCPACVKYNWQREIKLWTGEKSILVLSGKTGEHIGDSFKWVIANYDILAGWSEFLLARKFKYLIGDESTYINNPKALRSKAFIQLARTIPKRVLLSATPIRNRPSEFYTALNLVDRKQFSNRRIYLNRYCDPKHNGFAWVYKGLTNAEELFAKVSSVMFRKKKEDVFKDLPKKRKIIVPFALDNMTQKRYTKASSEFVDWAHTTETKTMADGKKHIETLRQLAYIGKREGVIEWIGSFLESGEKLVVFAWHTDAINDIHNAFKKQSVVVDGHIGSVQKQANIDSFQDDPKIRLFIGQITAAGVGITLTAASSLAIVEFPWTPGDLEQAMGRIDRIGQMSPTVSFYYLVGAGTVDEDTALLLDEKSKMLNTTLDGVAGEEIFGTSIADMLVDLYKKKGE
jgi:SWI/SNF-related matrix-associated actin-dependent regulator 1 of chromatin subfamily A